MPTAAHNNGRWDVIVQIARMYPTHMKQSNRIYLNTSEEIKLSNTCNKTGEDIFTDSSHIGPMSLGFLQIWLVVITVMTPTQEDYW
jgi:hypothetical protein